MKKSIRNLSEKIKQQDLSESEKNDLRVFLLNFAKNNPVIQSPVRKSFLTRHILAWRENLIFNPKYMTASIILLLVIALSGGTSLAAEQALPGNLLYPVKVNVNEPLRASTNFSADAKAEWEINRMERRLVELTSLENQKKLTAELSAQLQADIENQERRIAELVANIENDEQRLRIYSLWESTLKAYAQILLALTADNEDLAEVTVDVAEQARVAFDNRSGAEQLFINATTTITLTAAEGKLKAAGNKITEVKNYVERKSDRLGENIKAEIDTLIADADESYAKAQANIEAELYAEAFIEAHRAHRLAQQAKILAATNKHLKANLPIQAAINAAVNLDNNTTTENGRPDDNKKPLPVQLRRNSEQAIDRIIESAREIRDRMKETLPDSLNTSTETRIEGEVEENSNDTDRRGRTEVEIESETNTDEDSINTEVRDSINLQLNR